MTLYWRTQPPLDRSYKVTVQSYYGNGVKVAQHDAVPVCDCDPRTGWSPGKMIEDKHKLSVAVDAPPGAYPLYVGLYDAETGAPLPVLDGVGKPIGNQFQLGEIKIE